MTLGLYAGADPRRKGDVTLVFNATQQRLKCFHSDGMLQWSVDARGAGSQDDFRENGDTPPGIYALSTPEAIKPNEAEAKALGRWFIPMSATISRHYFLNKRKNIGIHGGGSDLRSPLAPRQGWETTKGCIRVQNTDLERVASTVSNTLAKGHGAWVHVMWFEFDARGKPVSAQAY